MSNENPYASPGHEEESSPKNSAKAPLTAPAPFIHWRLLPVVAVIMPSCGAAFFGFLFLLIAILMFVENWGDAGRRGGLAIGAGIGLSLFTAGILGFYAAYLLAKKRWRGLAITGGCIVAIYSVVGIAFIYLRAR